MVQMAVCINAASGPNGFYQLPDAIIYVRSVLLRNRFWLVWKITTLRDILCSSCSMGDTNHLEPSLVTLFPLWSVGMGLAEFNLLEKTTDEKNQSERSAVTIGDFVKCLFYSNNNAKLLCREHWILSEIKCINFFIIKIKS